MSVFVVSCQTRALGKLPVKARDAVVTCEIKLFSNNFENISVFYFTCNHRNWLHLK